MRTALWLLTLFALAVAVALFAGNNQGTVTLFWPPYRIDLSLNLVLLLLVALFFVLHVALRALAALLALPRQARDWRAQRLERALQSGLLDALAHLVAGRYLRARKLAESLLAQEHALSRQEAQRLPHGARLRALSHLLAAESAHALQDRAARDEHVRQALAQAGAREEVEIREGLQLRLVRWAFEDRDVPLALQRLQELPQGVARRTLALRLRFKVARLARQSQLALETVRLLGKHRAFSAVAARGIARGLALELLGAAHDPAQLQQLWGQLDDAERRLPEVAMAGATRLLALGGEAALALHWLEPVWEQWMAPPVASEALPPALQLRLALTLEQVFARGGAPDAAWLARIENEQLRRPGDPLLQYLAGMACLQLSLWGKAQALLRHSLAQLHDARLRRNVWRALAQLAEQREDAAGAAQAWRNAARENAHESELDAHA